MTAIGVPMNVIPARFEGLNVQFWRTHVPSRGKVGTRIPTPVIFKQPSDYGV